MRGEAAALHGGEPLADRVDLDDVRAAGEELSGDVPQLVQRDQRLFEQRAAAAGEQEEHGVVLAQSLRQFEGSGGRPDAVLVRHGMPCLKEAQRRELPSQMAVFGDDEAVRGGDFQRPQRGRGHTPGRLADGDGENAARKPLSFQSALHRLVRQHGVDGGQGRRFGVGAQLSFYTLVPLSCLSNLCFYCTTCRVPGKARGKKKKRSGLRKTGRTCGAFRGCGDQIT